ncbi:hypothetical protein BKA62DRAFT_784493 [Auriculariales sp. MPI-PUGE-AT-0066]|nr:hypothetical protein BKA62DRAFT_784493 [Auriculariales sp. MPI-PUGE-AT-0066]
MGILTLPIELLDRVLLQVDELRDIAACSQTCTTLRVLVHGPHAAQLWRNLYLRELDDPRTTTTDDDDPPPNSKPEPKPEPKSSTSVVAVAPVDWRVKLQRIHRARAVLQSTKVAPADLDAEERRMTFATLVELTLSAAPVDHTAIHGLRFSANTYWIDVALRLKGPDAAATPSLDLPGAYFLHPLVLDESLPATEAGNAPDIQAMFKFQSIIGIPAGLTAIDKLAVRRAARLFVYDEDNYRYLPAAERRDHASGAMSTSDEFGPFLDGGAVNWRAIFYNIVIVWMCCPTADALPPHGIECWRPALNVPHDLPHDWAGIEGIWLFYTIIPDPNDIFRFNFPSTSTSGEKLSRTPDVFHSSSFEDTMTVVEFVYRLVAPGSDEWHRIGHVPEGGHINGLGGATEIPPLAPDEQELPELRFTGRGRVALVLDGRVWRRADGIIRWTIWTRTPDDRLGWLSQGIQLGDMKSEAGVIGQWMTNPMNNGLGPFWAFRTSRLAPHMRADPSWLPPEDRLGQALA